MPNIRQVAERAGVSAITVSLALRNSPRVAATTRERIRAVAESMDYYPDPKISSVMGRVREGRLRSGPLVLAALDTWPDSEWEKGRGYTNLLRGARERARELGCRLDEFRLHEPGMSLKKIRQILHARGVEGLFVLPMSRPNSHLKMNLEGFASVAFGYTLVRPSLHRVAPDNIGNVRLALRYLRKQGLRRVGLVLPQAMVRRVDGLWVAAYCEATVGRPQFLPPLILKESQAPPFHAWIREHRPQAILFSLLPVRRWLDEAGLRVPEEVALMDLDHDTANGDASIDQRLESLGRCAIERLVAQLQRNEMGLPALPQTITLPGVVVESGPVGVH